MQGVRMQTSCPGTAFPLRWVSLLKDRCGLSVPLNEDKITGGAGGVEGGSGFSDCLPVVIDASSLEIALAVWSRRPTWRRIEREPPICWRFHMNIALPLLHTISTKSCLA